MSSITIDGVTAGGHTPTWIIPSALITTDPVDGTWSIPLAALTDESTVQIDCYQDFGDTTVTRTPQTRTRQRISQIVAQTRKTGETIDVTIAGVYDQQEAMTDDVNLAYAALPEGAEVYVAQAFGHPSGTAPTATTVIDLVKGEVQTRSKSQPTAADEDLKFAATLSGSGFWADVALTDAA
ncbi:hypothetical protein H9L10_03530 [Phycicoccus endophyticus]|uniref:Uncharacterized protein n=1 Tax=Phycicoccus endophyticus TaxID=1690220 RepID=A0A7G9R3G5_9MICO|nr:hypothetical protein [Phycicoccus endophyticus]NHI19896.1 hypothetical protein [Phycicoccus endophyticus]QNN50140.1 hypothetical protein H9L10_03530 [Phycicoccus endophyticus]GGL27678.1 hypothetical protein GCM10012283_07370 [Phycicoccus endophyticus]